MSADIARKFESSVDEITAAARHDLRNAVMDYAPFTPVAKRALLICVVSFPRLNALRAFKPDEPPAHNTYDDFLFRFYQAVEQNVFSVGLANNKNVLLQIIRAAKKEAPDDKNVDVVSDYIEFVVRVQNDAVALGGVEKRNLIEHIQYYLDFKPILASNLRWIGNTDPALRKRLTKNQPPFMTRGMREMLFSPAAWEVECRKLVARCYEDAEFRARFRRELEDIAKEVSSESGDAHGKMLDFSYGLQRFSDADRKRIMDQQIREDVPFPWYFLAEGANYEKYVASALFEKIFIREHIAQVARFLSLLDIKR